MKGLLPYSIGAGLIGAILALMGYPIAKPDGASGVNVAILVGCLILWSIVYTTKENKK
jgi:hypothetical protein